MSDRGAGAGQFTTLQTPFHLITLSTNQLIPASLHGFKTTHMIRKYIFGLALACCALTGKGQDKPLMAQGVSPNLYLNHTVAAKENYYSIGRLYNASPKDQIAPFNNLQMEKGLSPGQVIKVPLAANNFSQDGTVAADEALVPVYHTVQEKEGLYRISVTYNKVPLATLKQWNKLPGDVVSNGTRLIVGYLRVKKSLSPLAGMAVNPPAVTAPVVAPKPEPAKPEPVAPVVEPPKPVVTEPVKKDPPKPQPEPVKPVVTANPVSGNGINFNGGQFKSQYPNNGEWATESGAANVFKSNSGWSDGKYYCLHNSAQPGTIVKITSTATGKSVYAKVLDAIPDIKQNNGLLVRLSNAAAEELGVGENKFDCTLTYSK
jgi:LysM repeat protein